MDEYATIAEAAGALGVSDRRVRYMVTAGAFAGAVKRGRDWLIPRGALKQELATRRRIPARLERGRPPKPPPGPPPPKPPSSLDSPT